MSAPSVVEQGAAKVTLPVYGVDLPRLRRARGWSQAQMIAALRVAAAGRGEQLPADDNLKRRVAAWENGHSGLSAFYAGLFSLVFGRRVLPGHPPVLEVAQDPPAAMDATVDVAAVRRRLAAMAAEIAELSRVLDRTVHSGVTAGGA